MKSVVSELLAAAITSVYEHEVVASRLVIMRTKKSFSGEFSLVLHPLTKQLAVDIKDLGATLGQYLVDNYAEVDAYNHAAGFLNLQFSNSFWQQMFQAQEHTKPVNVGQSKRVLVEYGSPNTNKPLHLGHVRNCIIGKSLTNVLTAVGYDVVSVQIINDRGIHICQSMAAWQVDAQGATPESTGMKGDHFVGKYYVRYNEIYQSELQNLVDQGIDLDAAKLKVPIYLVAQKMLRDWEAGDSTVRALWKQMNTWVYSGFDVTYERMGVAFDKNYYESDTYLLGKKLVLEGLDAGLFYKKPDGSIWVDMTQYDLDHKLLLRADETSVYMTQDIGTAVLRFEDYAFDKMVYTVANEQDYHFKVLFKILELAGYQWAKNLEHLSYGIVLLPQGRMKSREGTIVDADDLLNTMITNASDATESLGKAKDFSQVDLEHLHHAIARAALYYWVLKVDAKKDMLFNPEESIAFTGNTGPFIMYTYARICSVMRKCQEDITVDIAETDINAQERDIIITLDQYHDVLLEAAESLNPSVLVGYVYALAKLYNTYYHDIPILKAESYALKIWRLKLSMSVADKINQVASMLNITLVAKM